ncbi:MAG: tyrosine-type recombinase/integrase [Chloroflexi bacterium]|nr:tyrosine-type recombinase/integrase [Chloroflexota bacterium]
MKTNGRRREEGSITSYKDGWRIWVTVGRNAAGKWIRKSEIVTSPLKDDARRRLRALLQEIEIGSYDAADSVTFAQFFRRWWPSKAANLSPTSAVGVRRVLEKYAIPRIGRRPVDRIKATDLSPLIGALVERERVGQSIKLFQALRLTFNAAVKQRVIPRSPMEGVEKPRQPHHEMRTLTPEEWRRIEADLIERDSWALVPFTVLLTCGLRRSECCALRWSDIDLDGRILTVQRSYHVLPGRKSVVRSPKTKQSRRTLALDPWTAQRLKEHHAAAINAAQMLGRPFSENDYLFARLDGSPWPPDTLTQHWDRTVARVGIRCRLHDLRHSSASLLLASGSDIRLISARLGHASPGFTLSTYAHLLPDAQAEAAERLGALLQNGHRPALSAGGENGEIAHVSAHAAS